jgi:hypothetical protein
MAGRVLRGYAAFMEKRSERAQAAELDHAVEQIAVRRDRLLASLTLIAGVGVIVGLPF